MEKVEKRKGGKDDETVNDKENEIDKNRDNEDEEEDSEFEEEVWKVRPMPILPLRGTDARSNTRP